MRRHGLCPALRLPLVKSDAPRSVVCGRPAGCWVPCSRLILGFSARDLRSVFVRRPRHLSMALHPSASFPASPESFRPVTCPRAFRPSERLPWGPHPSSRHQLPASTTPRGIPTPRSRSVPGVSHALDGLLRQKPSRVCFTPQPRPGFALQGIVPLRGAVRGFPRRVMPSCRWTQPPVTSACALVFRALLPAASAVSVVVD